MKLSVLRRALLSLSSWATTPTIAPIPTPLIWPILCCFCFGAGFRYVLLNNPQDTFNANYNSKSFIAATLLCAVVSALMAKIGLHDELSLRPAAYNLESPLIELPLYLGLGVVAGLVAVMFKYFSRKVWGPWLLLQLLLLLSLCLLLLPSSSCLKAAQPLSDALPIPYSGAIGWGRQTSVVIGYRKHVPTNYKE